MELTENYKRKLLSHVTIDNPKLFSILYDNNLLPECCNYPNQEYMMYGMIAMFVTLDHNTKFKLLESAIKGVISYVQKDDDAPMSASTHLNHAIYTIFSTLPAEFTDLETLRKNGCRVLSEAVTEQYLLTGQIDEKLESFIEHESRSTL